MAPPNPFARFAQCVCDGARLMVGVPNYETYVEHLATTHPDRVPMTRTEFFRDRQDARYGAGGRGGFRCC
jgi:uncharacterized short protein YbdD (DUF466 family)